MNAFELKNNMSSAEINEYAEVSSVHPTLVCGMHTIQATETTLKNLDGDNALGPDRVQTKILKRCAHAMAPIPHRLIIRIIIFGGWPMLWVVHSVVPFHKRKSVYDTNNYRNTRLTS